MTTLQNDEDLFTTLKSQFDSRSERFISKNKTRQKMFLSILKLFLLIFQVTYFCSSRNNLFSYFSGIENSIKKLVLTKEMMQNKIYGAYHNQFKELWTNYIRVNQNGLTTLFDENILNAKPSFRICRITTDAKIIDVIVEKRKKDCTIVETDDQLKEFIAKKCEISERNWWINIEFYLSSTNKYIKNTQKQSVCYLHRVNINVKNLNFEKYVSFNYGIKHKVAKFCPNNTLVKKNEYEIPILVSSSLTICVSLISMFLSITSLMNLHNMLLKLERYMQKSLLVSGLTIGEKMSLIDSWDIVYIISDTFNIVSSACMISIIDEKLIESFDILSVLLGIGVLITSSSNIQLLENWDVFHILMCSLRNGIKPMMKFSVCVIVIYCGCCVSFYSIFSSYHPKFASIKTTVLTLFSLLNGDDLYPTFDEIKTTNTAIRLLEVLFLTLFIFVFVIIITSIYVAILSTEFHKYKIHGIPKPKNELILNKIKIIFDKKTNFR